SRAVAVVDLAAITHNVRTLAARTATPVMAVVKADGYGHGAVPAARAALAGGAAMLGVAYPSEAVALRAARVDAPLLAWVWAPDDDITAALAAGVALGVSSVPQLERVLAARVSGAVIHLKVDTGLGRGGAGPADWDTLCQRVGVAAADGLVRVEGVMSHLGSSEVIGDASIGEQRAVFEDALAAARAAGLVPRYRHLANTAAALGTPDTRYDLVRCGIGVYGLDPLDETGLRDRHGLRPAMSLRSTVALTKRVPAGQGVSYGFTYRTTAETTLALVPIGYADGVPRAASSRAEVATGGRRYRLAGRVAMDQVVIDVGDDVVAAGDEVILFGDGRDGAPTAADWAVACDTIDYEIVTRIGARVPRAYREFTG
ncbi:MAG: alanine racemase, partial [Nakamurella sp.]